MVQQNQIGLFPLLIGALYGTSLAGELLGTMPISDWTAMQVLGPLVGLIGSLGAIIIGAGLLLEWEIFPQEEPSSKKGGAAFAVIAIAGFGIGFVLLL